MTFKWKFILSMTAVWSFGYTSLILLWQHWADHKPFILRDAIIRLIIATVIGLGSSYFQWIGAGRPTHRNNGLLNRKFPTT